MPTWTHDCTFVAAVANKSYIVVALVEDGLADGKVPHGVFVHSKANGGWGNLGDAKWSPVGIAMLSQPDTTMVGLGEWGKALVSTNASRHEETVEDRGISTKGRGPLRAVRVIDGVAWAVGMDRQVYRRDGKDKWTCLDASIRPKKDDAGILGFEAIDGFSEKDVYAGGWGGELFHHDGKKWTQLDSPTNQLITGIVCAGNEKVYACGRQGLLMAGQKNRWKVIEHGVTSEDLFGIAWFKKKLYLASLHQLWVMKGNTLEPVELDDDIPGTCNLLTNTPDLLWSVGPKDIFKFDGTSWERVE